MADLKEMTKRVVEQEEETIRQDVEETRQNSEEEIKAARGKIEEERQRRKESIDAEVEQDYSIQKNTLQNQQRNSILASKQTIISKLLVEAKNKLNEINSDQFKTFTENVLKQFEEQGTVDLVVAEESSGIIDQMWLDQLSFSNLKVNLSEETVKNKSGIIIQQKGIEYNFLFDELVDEIKPDVVPGISQELFD